MTTDGATLIVEKPVPNALRVFFLAAGLFVIGISTWELHRGVWPISALSPFFLFLILGAYSVGFPIALAGLFGWQDTWTVVPGEIRIDRLNPFGKQQVRLLRSSLLAVQVVEKEAMEGPNTWVVQLVRSAGERFESRDFQSSAAAERLRAEILGVLERG